MFKKIKKTLNFEKDPYSMKKGSIEAHILKEKQILSQKSRLIQPLKEANREILLPDIHRSTTYYNSQHLNIHADVNVVKQKRKVSCDAHEVVSHHHYAQEKEDQWAVLRRIPSEVIDLNKDEIVNFRDQSTNTIKDYASDIIQTLKEKDMSMRPAACLARHKITPNLRAKMVDWMVEVMCSYKCSDQAFFLAVNFMDNFFEKTQMTANGNDLHLVGVTTMFMAAKFEEIYPMRLSVVHEKIAHKKLSIEEIMQKEGEILQALNFNLVSATIHDFVSNVLFQLNLKEQLNADLYEYLEKVCVYLEKTVVHDYELTTQYTYAELAASTLFVAFKVIEQLDSNFNLPRTMRKVTDILDIEEEALFTSANKVLFLMKNFEKIYPNFTNLKKFHYLGLPEENPTA